MCVCVGGGLTLLHLLPVYSSVAVQSVLTSAASIAPNVLVICTIKVSSPAQSSPMSVTHSIESASSMALKKTENNSRIKTVN